MKKRTDEEIQGFLDRGEEAAEGEDWPREDRRDLKAYALIREALSEEPGFALPPNFADAVADRLMPAVVTPVERVGFGALLAAFAGSGVAVAAVGLRALPMVFGGASRMAAAVAEHGRADILLAVAAVLATLALIDRVGPRVGPQVGPRVRPRSGLRGV
jgi:hypothetical protein